MNRDDVFENSAYIPGFREYPDKLAALSKAYRQNAQNAEYEISYSVHARETFDLFLPDANPVGVFVFVYGGYWMAFDKSSWSFLAEGARVRGWAVAIPSYVLTPAVRISEITRQIACLAKSAHAG